MEAVAKKPKVLKQPRLRYQSFKDDWKVEQLGEMLTFKNGVNAVKEQYGSGYKFINVLDILQNDFITHDVIIGSVELSEADFKKNEVVYGDILFQRSSETREEVGQANVYLDKTHTAAFGGFVIRGRAKKEYSPEFMNYLLRTDKARQEITTKSGGSTRYNVGQEVLEGVSVILPTLPEQQKIAAFLGAVDRKIQQLKRKQELLERYKKGVVQQLFSQELRFKKKDGGEFPEWEERELGTITQRVTGKNTDLKVETVLTNSATQGIVSQRDYFDKDIANANNIGGYYVVRKDDFVYNPRISATAPVGPIKRNHLDTGIMSPLYTVFRFTETDVDFFECYFDSMAWHDYMRSVANYGARHDRMNITMDDLFGLPVPFPCDEERGKIAGFLMALDAKVAGVAQAVAAAQKWKKGLLQQMFV